MSSDGSLRLLFVVEGFTDIRFVLGLHEICDLSLLVPNQQFTGSGLEKRIADTASIIPTIKLQGGRLAYQARCFKYLWREARKFDVILSQEMLRGSLNACIVGRLRGTPVVTYTCLPALEYFRCRRERKQIGPLEFISGSALIKFLVAANGLLADRAVALGPYLFALVSKYSRHTRRGLYYGVDTNLYHPVEREEKLALRKKLRLPLDKFLIFCSSRISHEKDPETVLLATAKVRDQGLDACVVNLGGGYKDFLRLAENLQLPSPQDYVYARPAAHPMSDLADYYRAADCLALASLEEGLGMSPLESLACGTPAVCTSVGGLKTFAEYARLTPRRDPSSMARQFVWIANNPNEARNQALRGRDYVVRNWNRQKAFADLAVVLSEVSKTNHAGSLGL